MRATIALVVGLVVGFVVVAQSSYAAEAAEPEAAPAGSAEDEAAPPRPERPDDAPPVSRGAPGRVPGGALGALPAQPFGAGGTDDEGDVDEAGSGESDDEAPGAPLRALSCLEGEGGNDTDGARRGVQKKDFLKRHRFELSAHGGYYAADSLSSTYVYGGSLSFFFSEDFGVEAMVLRNPVSFRLENAFKSFDLQQHFQPGIAWNVLGALAWSPVHAKLRFSDRHITHADLMINVGGGQTFSDVAQGFTWQVGLGLKLYLARFFSLRIDVRDLIIPQEVLGNGRNTHNVTSMVGLSGWIPG